MRTNAEHAGTWKTPLSGLGDWGSRVQISPLRPNKINDLEASRGLNGSAKNGRGTTAEPNRAGFGCGRVAHSNSAGRLRTRASVGGRLDPSGLKSARQRPTSAFLGACAKQSPRPRATGGLSSVQSGAAASASRGVARSISSSADAHRTRSTSQSSIGGCAGVMARARVDPTGSWASAGEHGIGREHGASDGVDTAALARACGARLAAAGQGVGPLRGAQGCLRRWGNRL